MGILSYFDGMYIFYYSDDHDPPHLHVMYAGQESIIELSGALRKNNLPPGKLKILRQWMNKHKDELFLNWERRNAGKRILKIKPWSKDDK